MANEVYNFYYKIDEVAYEAYKVIRTNIGFACQNDKIKTLTVISSMPREGKTATTINLSISMAQSGKRILLVDADLRKQNILKGNRKNKNVGLTDFITDKVAIEDIIYKTNIENLYYTSCGQKISLTSEALETKKFLEFMNEVKDKFDYAIFDSSSLCLGIDSAVLASKTDGVVLVVGVDIINNKMFSATKQQLDNVNANLVGVILNNVPKGKRKKSSYYYIDNTTNSKVKNKRNKYNAQV